MLRRNLAIAAVLCSLALLAGCAPQRAEGEVWAEVNGRPIFREAVEKRFERDTARLSEKLTDEEELSRKLNILQGLILKEILLQRAELAGLLVSDREVDARLSELHGPLSDSEFLKRLEKEGLTLDDLRDDLRAELSSRKLMDDALKNGLTVSEKEMRDYYAAQENHFRLVEAHYHVAVILVTPRAEQEIRNLGNNDARSFEEARRKIQTLVERLRAGEDFAELARQYSEDPVTTLSGGDLGFFPESALQETNPALRSAVMRLRVGQWTGPVRTPRGLTLVKLLEREEPGLREFSSASVQKAIRESLQRAKRRLLEAAYLERARNEVRVVNYFARQVLDDRRVSR